MRRNLLLLSALALAISLPSLADAQINSQRRSGTFGQRTLGSTLGNPTSSFGGTTGNGTDTAGSLTGNERFLRDARQPGAFVGRSGTDGGLVGQQNAGATGGTGMNGLGGMGGLGRTGLGGMNSLGGLGGLGGMRGGNLNMLGRGGTGNLGGLFGSQLNQNMRGGQGARQPLRTPITLGFTPPSPTVASTRVTTTVSTRLTKIPQLQVTGPLSVTMEGSTAVLRGHVGSEGDRDLAERMVLLEPGISSVRNELEVRPAPEAEPIPTPAAVVTPPVDD